MKAWRFRRQKTLWPNMPLMCWTESRTWVVFSRLRTWSTVCCRSTSAVHLRTVIVVSSSSSRQCQWANHATTSQLFWLASAQVKCTSKSMSFVAKYITIRYIAILHCVSKTHQLWNGIALNYKDRFWWHLAEIFTILQIEFVCFSFHVGLLVITLSSLKLHTENNSCMLTGSVTRNFRHFRWCNLIV